MAEGGFPPDAPRGLPPGCEMYYDVAARFDRRHARGLIRDSNALIQRFIQAHGMGRDHPDQEFKKQANDLRSQLAAQKLTISEICDKFTVIAERDSLISQVGHMQMTLDSHAAFEFPPIIEIDQQVADSFLNRIGGNMVPPLPQFPINVSLTPFNRFNLLGTTPQAVGPFAPREPLIGPPPPPPLVASAPLIASPALLAPPVRPALPAPTATTMEPTGTVQPPNSLIAFSESSRAPSLTHRETGREIAPVGTINAAQRRENPARSNTPSIHSEISEESSSISSSVQSNRTFEEDLPASAAVGEINTTLRVRCDAIIRKRQRFERRIQRYDEEVNRLATQMQSNSLNAIERHVNAAVGELNSVLNNPPSGGVLVPTGPNRTESWIATQNDPQQATVSSADSVSSCSRNDDRENRPPRSRNSSHRRDRSNNPSIIDDRVNQTRSTGHSRGQSIASVVRRDDTPQSQFSHDPEQTYPVPNPGQNQNLPLPLSAQVQSGQPDHHSSDSSSSTLTSSTIRRISQAGGNEPNHHSANPHLAQPNPANNPAGGFMAASGSPAACTSTINPPVHPAPPSGQNLPWPNPQLFRPDLWPYLDPRFQMLPSSLPIYPTLNPVGPINPQSNSVPQAMAAAADSSRTPANPTSAAEASSNPDAATQPSTTTNPPPVAINPAPEDPTPSSDEEDDFQSTVTSPPTHQSPTGVVTHSRLDTINNPSDTDGSPANVSSANSANPANPVNAVSNQPDAAQDAAVTLMLIHAATNSRDYLKSNRLPVDQRFNGLHNVDFESTLLRFKRVTKESKVGPQEMCYELKHYFSGDAAKICELYEGEGDPEENLDKAIKHLKREYGYASRSAQAIVDRLLSGNPIDRDDSASFKKFRINLEGEVTKAKSSGRASSFDNSDTINKIIRKKLPFVQQRWAVERSKKMLATDPELVEAEPRFDDFLSFLRSQNLIRDEAELISGSTEKKKPKINTRTMKIDAMATSSTPAYGHSEAATAVNQSHQGGRGGGRRGRGRGGRGNGNNNSTPANTPPPPINTSPTPKPSFKQQKAALLAAANLEAERNKENHQTQTFGGGKRGGGGGGQQNRNHQTSTPATGGNSQTAAKSHPSAGNWNCPCCNRSKFHELANCKEFIAKAQPDRYLFLRSKGFCNKCLGRGHMAKDCKSEVSCNLCSGRFHHPLLHRDFTKKTEQAQDSDSDDGEDAYSDDAD